MVREDCEINSVRLQSSPFDTIDDLIWIINCGGESDGTGKGYGNGYGYGSGHGNGHGNGHGSVSSRSSE